MPDKKRCGIKTGIGLSAPTRWPERTQAFKIKGMPSTTANQRNVTRASDHSRKRTVAQHEMVVQRATDMEADGDQQQDRQRGEDIARLTTDG